MADESGLSTNIVFIPGTHGIACESDKRISRVSELLAISFFMARSLYKESMSTIYTM